MTGWWSARRQLHERERALGPAVQEFAASKAGLDLRLRRSSPLLLTAGGFSLGFVAGRAGRWRRRLPLPRLHALLLANLDKAVALLLAWAMRPHSSTRQSKENGYEQDQR